MNKFCKQGIPNALFVKLTTNQCLLAVLAVHYNNMLPNS